MTRRAALLAALSLTACTHAASVAPAAPAGPAPPGPAPTMVEQRRHDGLAATTQLVVVTTASWDTTGGVLQRYERARAGDEWRRVGAEVPVVVGRAGLGWDDRLVPHAGAPVKREGDGRAPAGVWAIDTLFGFAPAAEAAWARLPYTPLVAGSECVDDVASVHYNTVVDRGTVARVDWTSAERMREIGQYRFGAIVGYNAPPRAGRGSCIFLHVWGGPGSSTAGCTAMAERDLRDVLLWLDGARHPLLVQLPAPEYARVRAPWHLP